MLFNSFVFLFAFLPLTYAVWTLFCRLGKTRAALDWLVLASLFFYGWWHPPYLGLLCASILANCVLQQRIGKLLAADGKRAAKGWLVAGIVLNLAALGLFRYQGFFLENLNLLFRTHVETLGLVVPLGLSFFTLKQIACLVDTYRGRVGAVCLRSFALFSAFFPQLVTGPIVRADRLVPQFENGRLFSFSWANTYMGLVLFALGMFKKVAIADRLAPGVANVFDNLGVGTVECLDAWMGAVGWTFQLYFDFSGYCDMALGLALLFNVRLPVNFNSPFRAASMVEFWRRWHVTLARFFRDGLYLPLARESVDEARQHAALFASMLVLGLWHGAGWTFVLFGALHGAYLCVNRLWMKFSPVRLPRGLGVALTFVCLVFAFGICRAGTLPKADILVQTMFSFEDLQAFELPDSLQDISNLSWGLFACAAICFLLPNSIQVARRLREWTKNSLAAAKDAGGIPLEIGALGGDEPREEPGRGSAPGLAAAAVRRAIPHLVSLVLGGLLAASFLLLNAVSEFLY